jgi:hypothetical protein
MTCHIITVSTSCVSNDNLFLFRPLFSLELQGRRSVSISAQIIIIAFFCLSVPFLQLYKIYYQTYFIEERVFSVRHSHSFLGVSQCCYWNLLYIMQCELEDLVSAVQWKNKMDWECLRTKFCQKILASKMEEVRRWWSRLHNEKPHNLFSSPDIIRVIRSEKMRWMRYGEMRNYYTVIGIPKWYDSLSYRGVTWKGAV